MSPSCLEAATACCLMRANNCSATGWSSSYAWSTIFCAAENCWCTHANFTAYSTYLWSRKHGLHYYNSQPKYFLRSSLPLKPLEHAIRILKLNSNCLREIIRVIKNSNPCAKKRKFPIKVFKHCAKSFFLGLGWW